jgi:hypothetical protein
VIAIDHEEALLVGRVAHGEHKKMIPGRVRGFADNRVVLEYVVNDSLILSGGCDRHNLSTITAN